MSEPHRVDGSNAEVKVRGDTLVVNIAYPRHGPVEYVEVDQMSTRASDGIRLRYDYERNGWSIEQPSWPKPEDSVHFDYGWTEVAFVESWALGQPEP